MSASGERGQARPDRGSERGDRGRGTSGRPAGGRPREGARRARPAEPELPDDVTGRELDRTIRAQLGALAAKNAETVARHLVMAGRLLEDEPEEAFRHAMAAQGRAARVGAVREAAGLAAYAAGHYAEALAELRAARRMTGEAALLPVMADCERGLGRSERALALASSPEARELDAAGRVEMAIVVSGARRDLGQHDAAVLALQALLPRDEARRPWSPRLFYAYAEALLAAGRRDDAALWFSRAAEADDEGETDAASRAGELTGVTFLDDDDDDDDDAGDDAGDPADHTPADHTPA